MTGEIGIIGSAPGVTTVPDGCIVGVAAGIVTGAAGIVTGATGVTIVIEG
jgi:hypothetical protein